VKWSTAALFCVLIFLRLNAIGQMESNGTIVIITASEKELVIAADSRRNSPYSYVDDDCKISAFGNKVIFAASGRAGPRNDPTSQFWDAHAIARQQFQRLFASKSTSDTLALELAKAWGMEIKKEIEKRLRRKLKVLAGIDDYAIMTGFFAGVRKDGSVMGVMQAVTYEDMKNGGTQINLPSPRSVASTDYPAWLGRSEIIRELYAGRTPRSQQWGRKIIEIVRASPDRLAARAIEEVRVTIENLPPEKTDYNGVPFSVVGFPISAIRLTSEGAEWVEKGNCPQK
jgi:hypothetical protein